MMLPTPEIVRGWIIADYRPQDLRAAECSHAVQEAIAKDICIRHNVESFDDRLNVLYHVEDIIEEMRE